MDGEEEGVAGFVEAIFHEYADPTGMLDAALSVGDACGLLASVRKANAKRASDGVMWDVWLNRVWNMSYQEYVGSIEDAGARESAPPPPTSPDDQEAIIRMALAVAGLHD